METGARHHLGLVLDAVRVEIVLGAWNPPAAPVSLGRDHCRMGSRIRMMAALLGTLSAIWAA
jgi:hypothetical protein